MRAFRNQPIRRKMLLIVVFATVVALLISGVVFGVHQHYFARAKLVRDLDVTAAIVGDNCSAALAFNSSENAAEILRSLEAQPNILAGSVYDPSGEVLASYQRVRQQPVPIPARQPGGHRFAEGRLELFRPIVKDGQTAGTICIVSSLEELDDQAVRYSLTVVFMQVLALGIIGLLAWRMQRMIWRPIQQLETAASTVAKEKNFSLRVQRESDDELGSLVTQFNSMLGEIEKREEALQQAHAELEKRVQERTKALNVEIAERRRAEEARKDSEALYSSLVEHIPMAVYRKDLLGRFTFVNDAFCTATARTREQLLGATDFDISEREYAEKFRRDDHQVMLNREKLAIEERRLAPNGEVQTIQVFKVPVVGADGAVKGTQGCFFDVTEQEKMREALAYERDLLRTLLDNSPDHIYFKDIRSRFIKCSVALARRLGFKDSAEIEGKTDADLFQGAHAEEALADERRIMQTGVAIVGKVEHEVWANGNETWVITTKVPYRDAEGKIIGTFGISKDITALKKAERELHELHSRLMDSSHKAGMAEVATGVLHNVGNVLNSINVSTTTVSEKIKHSRVTSLGKAAAMIDANRENLGDYLSTDPKGKQLPDYLVRLSEHLNAEHAALQDEISLLARHVEHVKEIVSMQQAYAKVSGVKEALLPIDLAEDAIRINGAALVRHDIHLIRDFQPTAKVLVDRHKVLQILINLISNAKYAMDAQQPEEKLLRISIRPAGEENVSIIVEDNGVGIARDHFSRIFEHGFTTRKDGHGFGLHSSALAAKELGGGLTVHSEGPGQGAKFCLTLPIESAASVEAAAVTAFADATSRFA